MSPVIMMNREVIDVLTGSAQHSAIPVHVVVAYRDQFDRRIDGAHRFRVTVVVARVRFGVRVTTHPVAPDLVPDFPKLHAKWSRVTVRSTHRAILRSRRTVTVF